MMQLRHERSGAMTGIHQRELRSVEISRWFTVCTARTSVRPASRRARRAGLAIFSKMRHAPDTAAMLDMVGEVSGKLAIIVDDMISTGGTIAASVAALRGAGARPEITVAATHGLLLEGARDKLTRAGVCEVLVTDTVPVGEQD